VDSEILAGGPWDDFTLAALLDEYSFGRFVNIFSLFLRRFLLERGMIYL